MMKLVVGLLLLTIAAVAANPFAEPIEAAIERGDIPGAVVYFKTGDQPAITGAFGNRVLHPSKERMSEDTIFDAASLTKVLATAPSIALLWERGKINLDAPIIEYLPEFAPPPPLRPLFIDKYDTSADTVANRGKVTVRHLLTHTSGLPPSISIRSEPWWGHREGIHRCLTTPLIKSPGTTFRYSDVGFILLGEIVERTGGQPLDEFAEENIFAPLGMSDTRFRPYFKDRSRIAPTVDFGELGILRGSVHDPTARRMEGVAGSAGVFTTAADVATFAECFLTGGFPLFEKAETAIAMTSPQSPSGITAIRGIGWDIDSPFSYQRGENFPVGGFGHTGWTGTSIWVDPVSRSTIILMANRNHPSESGSAKRLRIEVGTMAGKLAGLGKNAQDNQQPFVFDEVAAGDPATMILNGIDVLAGDHFAELDGLRVGLITNHTGISRERRSTIDLLHETKDVTLRALFAPEHGIRGELDTDKIDDSRDEKTGLPIFSLYKNKTRKPSAEQLAGLDALVFDIQDIGCRFYTYIATMGNAMEAAAEHDLKFFVLDRVNPIGGTKVDGPVRLGESKFVAWHDIPVQHGMTVGELASLFRAERTNLASLDLTVIPVKGWARDRFHDAATGLPWVNPSPNMRNLTQAILYPGIGLFEFTNISVGRGTDTPFELIGAPWIDDLELATALNTAGLEGVTITPIRFRPEASVHEGKVCGGVRFAITDREKLAPITIGLTLAKTLHRLYPNDYNLAEKGSTLLVHPPTLEALLADQPTTEIRALWQPAFDQFLERRAKFLRY